MAIFASTTTSGYSDPLKAMSIKALEQRQKDMLAQAAAGPGITPENTQTPIQGFGHVANQFADSLQQGRVAQAAAAQKQQLAQMIAQGPQGPNGDWSPQQLSTWSIADPEGMKQALQTMAENRRQQAGFTHADKAQGALFGHQDTTATALTEAQKAAATEAARVAEIARGQGYTHADAAAAQKVLDDQVTAAKLAETNKATAEAAAKVKAEEAATDPKRIEAEKVLEQEARTARDLVSELSIVHGDLQKGIYTGRLSGLSTIAGQLPGVGEYLGDPEKAARTDRFDVAMRKVATMDMSRTLKGSSTDKEMSEFRTLWNSPNATLEQKREAFKRVLNAAKQDEAIGQAALDRLGSKRLVPGGPEAAVAAKAATKPVDPVAEAQDAINRGAPFDEVVKRFKGDPSALKPKGP